MNKLEDFFATVNLPSVPQVARELISTLDRSHVGLADVSAIIARDPALSARLLRLANSAQFGLPRGVGRLDEALQLVGLARVRAVALGACLSDCFPQLGALDSQRFWAYCMRCAAYSQWLARQLDMDAGQAWLTGMMLRLGEVLIAQVCPQQMAEIEAQPALPGDRWARERRLVGYTEGQITAELARRWLFPMQISQALERAWDPLVEQAFSRLGAVLHLAGLLADMADPDAQCLQQLPRAVLDALQLQAGPLAADWLSAQNFLSLH